MKSYIETLTESGTLNRLGAARITAGTYDACIDNSRVLGIPVPILRVHNKPVRLPTALCGLLWTYAAPEVAYNAVRRSVREHLNMRAKLSALEVKSTDRTTLQVRSTRSGRISMAAPNTSAIPKRHVKLRPHQAEMLRALYAKGWKL